LTFGSFDLVFDGNLVVDQGGLLGQFLILVIFRPFFDPFGRDYAVLAVF
jgi:hypothetical protein